MPADLRVVPVPCLSDNYAYLVHALDRREALVVDASEAGPVLDAAAREKLTIAALLSTHHHADHVGGNTELAARLPGLPIFAHASELSRGRVPGQTEGLEDGSTFSAAGLEVRTMHVPGHTLSALAYVIRGAAFTGDTLFLAGSGRLFEGTPEMMLAALEALAALPGETQVFCGHEYTEKNLAFAAWVEPESVAIVSRRMHVASQRARGEPSVPATLSEERATNPFLRAREPTVAARFPEAKDPAAVFAALRAAKDAFRG